MTEIAHHDLSAYLKKARLPETPLWPPVLLLFGEEMLVKQALAKVREAILGAAVREVAYEAVEGLNENVGEALARLNTYGLLSRNKVVALTDARLFQSRQTANRLWEQAARAVKADDMKRAARFFLDILSLQNLTLNDLRGALLAEALDSPEGFDDIAWLAAVRDYCQQHGLAVPEATDPQEALQRAIEAGFPAGHHLIITTELVDKRRVLYKVIRDQGLVVDCSVPKGDRKADRQAQQTVLDATVDGVLGPSGKRMAPAARRALYEMTGFDLRTVSNSVEKLVHFTGDRERIEVDDVGQALERTRRDPLYTFTEAVSERQLSPSLFYLHSLLTGGDFDHPLPLLAAVANQMRRLLVAKDFLDGPHGRRWRPGCSYPQFQTQVLPDVKAFDAALQSALAIWDDDAPDEALAQEKKNPRKKGKPAVRTDLLMTGRGRSPYPIFKTLEKAERFARSELMTIMEAICDADRRLKRSPASGRLVLEQLLFTICSVGRETPSPRNVDGPAGAQRGPRHA